VANTNEHASVLKAKRTSWIRSGPAVEAGAGCNNKRTFYSGTMFIYDDSADIRV
jgi:hypothetical protein